MSVFILWAAVCALIAVMLLVWPLLRKRKDGNTPQYLWAISAGIVTLVAAALLYPLWSNWPWRAPPPADHESIAG